MTMAPSRQSPATSPGPDAAARVRFQNVSKSFGRIEVVRDVSFDIREDDFISLVGPSGCGKTTMMNMLAGFTEPDGGDVFLGDQPVTGPGPDRGVMFQDYGVFPWLSVERNIRFGLDLGVKRGLDRTEKTAIVERYMALMRLTEFRDAWPKTLSGGMRQRVALARAYAANPKFLLMDEPFGALDAQTRSAMHDLLLSMMRTERKTALLITHSVEESIYLSNRILVISARPSRVVEEIVVPFGEERDKEVLDTSEFVELRRYLRDLVMTQYENQQALGPGAAT